MDEKNCGRIDDHIGHEWEGHRERDDLLDFRPRPLVKFWCPGPPVTEGGNVNVGGRGR